MKKIIFGLLAVSSLSLMASVNDVGVIGPEGSVMLYYKEGSNIFIKNCLPHTVLGKTPQEARLNCKAEPVAVPVNYFKEVLRTTITSKLKAWLNPLTAQEIDAYLGNGKPREEIEALSAELEQIKAFLAAYGEEGNKTRKLQIEAILNQDKIRTSAVNKIKHEINNTVELVGDTNKLEIVTSNKNGSQFLYTILKNLNAKLPFPCGLEGTIAEKMENCSVYPGAQKNKFALVTRNNDGNEIYKDTSNGLIWGGIYEEDGGFLNYRFFDYSETAQTCAKKYENFIGLKMKWRLPSRAELLIGAKNGLTQTLHQDDGLIWSNDYSKSSAWTLNGNQLQSINQLEEAHIMCVSKED